MHLRNAYPAIIAPCAKIALISSRLYRETLENGKRSPLRTLVAYGYLFAMFGLASAAPAQTGSNPLTVDECITLAKNAPSSIRRAQEELRGAQFGVRGARAGFFPTLTIQNAFTYNSPLVYASDQFSFVALNGVHEYSSVASSSLELDSSGRLRAIYDKAAAVQQAAEANLHLSERDLERSVATSYYRLLLTRKLAASASENWHTALDFEGQTKHLLDGGEASEADLAKASLESALLERTAHSLQLEADLANHELASFWTEDTATHLEVSDQLDVAPAEPKALTTGGDYLNRPEFAFLRAQKRGYDADARQARAQTLPQINLNFQYGIDATHFTSRDRGYAGFIHFNIPVFDFLKAHSEQQRFHSQALASETTFTITQRLFSKEYQDAISSVEDTYAQIAIADRALDLARENLRLSRLRFEGGEGPALDVVAAQNTLMQADIDYYTTRANYLNAQLALKVASGQ